MTFYHLYKDKLRNINALCYNEQFKQIRFKSKQLLNDDEITKLSQQYMDKILTNNGTKSQDVMSSVINKVDNEEEKIQTENLLHNFNNLKEPNQENVNELKTARFNNRFEDNKINLNISNRSNSITEEQKKRFLYQQQSYNSQKSQQNNQVAKSRRSFDLFNLALPNIEISNPNHWF